MASVHGLVRRVRRAIGLDDRPELNPRLAAMERVFRAPPLTPELVTAIRLISPQFVFEATEKHRRIWRRTKTEPAGESTRRSPRFSARCRTPKKILEIGPGMGRSLVFFSRKLGWGSSEIHAYEGEGSSTRYTQMGPRGDDSYCGNIPVLRSVLEFNGIRNVRVFNAAEVQLTDLPGPYDFLYSFYSIGFHWSLEHFLSDLLPLLHDRSVAVFTVPQEFRPFPELEELPHRILDWKTVWPKDGRLKLLVLGKAALPDFH